jgi:microcystin-dependent protein
MANYIKSTNFTAKDSLPSGDSARIVKGTEIDVEFSAIASAVASKSDSNSPSFTGTPTAPTAPAGTNTTQIATTAFADAVAKAAFPVGGIILWSGSIAAIPATWQLCDGTNGTPNLRDRFIVGAGSTYSVGATGGANTVTLDATMLPAHTHSLSASGTTSGQSNDHAHSGTTSPVSNDHAHTFSGSTGGQSANHTHGMTFSRTSKSNNSTPFILSDPNVGENLNGSTTLTTGGVSSDHVHFISGTTSGITANHTHTVTTGGVSANHTHTVTVTGTSGGTGGGLAHENRPPYYALAYIQKMS